MTDPRSSKDNETRRVVATAVSNGLREVVLDCNPAFRTSRATLVEGSPGDVLVRFVAGEETTQGNGVVGGGTLANMLDSAMAIGVLSALGEGCTCSTISLTVNMLRPAMAGSLLVHAKVEKLGARVAFAVSQIMGEDRLPIATASSCLAIITLH